MIGSLLFAVWTPVPRDFGMKIKLPGRRLNPDGPRYFRARPYLKKKEAA